VKKNSPRPAAALRLRPAASPAALGRARGDDSRRRRDAVPVRAHGSTRRHAAHSDPREEVVLEEQHPHPPRLGRRGDLPRHLAREPVPVEVHRGCRGELGRDGAGQRVVAEVHGGARRDAPGRTKLPREGVLAELQVPDPAEREHLPGHLAGEPVPSEVEERQPVQPPQHGPDGSRQPVPRQREVHQRAWQRRDPAGQTVAPEVEVEQRRPDPARDLAGERVVGEDERPEVPELEERGRYPPREPVLTEVNGAERGREGGREVAGEEVPRECEEAEGREGGDGGGESPRDAARDEGEGRERGERGDGGGREGAREPRRARARVAERERGDAAGGGAGDAREGAGVPREVPGREEARAWEVRQGPPHHL